MTNILKTKNSYLSPRIIEILCGYSNVNIDKIKPVILALRARMAVLINFTIFISIFLKNCLKCDATHDFPEWLRNDFNPAADISQF